jgi:hypothetical protein
MVCLLGLLVVRRDGRDTSRVVMAEASRTSSTSTTAPPTTTQPTSTTAKPETLYGEMQAEIERACDVAMYSHTAPKVTFDSRWSSVGSEERLLAAAQECVDIRTAQSTTTTATPYVAPTTPAPIPGPAPSPTSPAPTPPPTTSPPALRTVTGEVDLPVVREPATCRWPDVLDPGQVTIEDASHRIVAVVGTDGGTKKRLGPGYECVYRFRAEIPASAFYIFTYSDNSPVTLSASDLDSMGWNVTLIDLSQGP